MIEEYNKSTFESCLNSKFELQHPVYGRMELTLAEVKTTEFPGMRESYNLYFKGDVSQLLEQQTYELSHPVAGPTLIFLVPVSKDTGSITYEAIFNTVS